MANSPTTVLPAPVGAQTSTPEPSSRASQASTWNGSRAKPSSAVKSDRVGCAVRRRAAAYRSAGLDMSPPYARPVAPVRGPPRGWEGWGDGGPSAGPPGTDDPQCAGHADRHRGQRAYRLAVGEGGQAGACQPHLPAAQHGDRRVVDVGADRQP